MADVTDRLALGVAVAALVPSIYGAALPPLSTLQISSTSRGHSSGWRAATCCAVGVVAAAGLISGSHEVVVLGGGMAAAYAALYWSAIRSQGPAA